MSTIAEERSKVCKSCPLYKKAWDGSHRCDNNKYLNPETMKVSYLPKAGFIRGCGCNVDKKIFSPTAKCVAGL